MIRRRIVCGWNRKQISIFTRVQRGDLLHISSTIVQAEINSNSNRELKLRLEEMAGNASEVIQIGKDQILRADELQGLGFHYFDALHIACAETAGVDVF